MARPHIRGGRSVAGFARADALAIVALLGSAGAAMLAMSCQSGQQVRGAGESPVTAAAGARASERALKCATQIRGIGQGMIIFAQNNGDLYPLPSQLDATDQTVRERGRAKDTTANIHSIMIFMGMYSPEMCVCPDEHSTRIGAYQNYEFSSPRAAAVPMNAIWDPAFGADFTAGKGNVSYANQQPSGELRDTGRKDKDGRPIMAGAGRLATWSNTFMSSEGMLGDRGPQVTGVTFANPQDPKTAHVSLARSDSVTFKNHGAPDSWEGNIAFNDNHVDLYTSLGPAIAPQMANTYRNAAGLQRFDSWYYDEPDDVERRNIFLGVFARAGSRPEDFRPIWD